MLRVEGIGVDRETGESPVSVGTSHKAINGPLTRHRLCVQKCSTSVTGLCEKATLELQVQADGTNCTVRGLYHQTDHRTVAPELWVMLHTSYNHVT